MAITDSTLPIPPQTTNNDGELKLNLEHLSRDEKPLDLDLSISIPTTEDKTDRLKQEDNLTKKATPQETPVTETPIVEPIQPEPTASPTTAELT